MPIQSLYYPPTHFNRSLLRMNWQHDYVMNGYIKKLFVIRPPELESIFMPWLCHILAGKLYLFFSMILERLYLVSNQVGPVFVHILQGENDIQHIWLTQVVKLASTERIMGETSWKIVHWNYLGTDLSSIYMPPSPAHKLFLFISAAKLTKCKLMSLISS